MLLMLTLLLTGCSVDEETGVELPTAGDLLALTYNVHGLPPELTGDDTTGRQELIAPLLGPYDLVALQEDFIESNHEILADASEHPVERWFDEAVDGRALGAGLAVFTDLAEELYYSQHYSSCYGYIENAADCMASKGFMLLRLELGAVSLDLYNTHHEAGGAEEDVAARLTQVEELLAAMEEHSEGRAVLLLGDFNLDDDDEEDQIPLELYRDFGLQDACDALSCPDPGRIDRAWFRDGDDLDLSPTSWEVQEHFVDDQGEHLSDHEPIAFGFDWAAL